MISRVSEFVDLCEDLCDANWDAPVVATGRRGAGKSTLIIQVMKDWFRRQGKVYNPVRDMPFSRDELHDLIDNGGKKRGIHGDELVGILFSRNWHDPEQIATNMKLDRSRHENQLIGGCIPRFTALDSHFRNSVVSFWLHVYKRGYAYIFQADDNPAATDVFDLKNINKRWISRTVQKHHLFRGEIMFKPLTRREEDIYDEVKKIKRAIVEHTELKAAKLRNNWRAKRGRADA